MSTFQVPVPPRTQYPCEGVPRSEMRFRNRRWPALLVAACLLLSGIISAAEPAVDEQDRVAEACAKLAAAAAGRSFVALFECIREHADGKVDEEKLPTEIAWSASGKARLAVCAPGGLLSEARYAEGRMILVKFEGKPAGLEVMECLKEVYRDLAALEKEFDDLAAHFPELKENPFKSSVTTLAEGAGPPMLILSIDWSGEEEKPFKLNAMLRTAKEGDSDFSWLDAPLTWKNVTVVEQDDLVRFSTADRILEVSLRTGMLVRHKLFDKEHGSDTIRLTEYREGDPAPSLFDLNVEKAETLDPRLHRLMRGMRVQAIVIVLNSFLVGLIPEDTTTMSRKQTRSLARFLAAALNRSLGRVAGEAFCREKAQIVFRRLTEAQRSEEGLKQVAEAESIKLAKGLAVMIVHLVRKEDKFKDNEALRKFFRKLYAYGTFAGLQPTLQRGLERALREIAAEEAAKEF